MKYINIIFLLLTSNMIIAMEAECKSLASFLIIGLCDQHKDIAQAVMQRHFSEKWWYVDKEIQFRNEKKKIPKMIRYKNYLKSVCFNDTGTKIIAFPKDGGDYVAYIWSRDGTELERVYGDDWSIFCENNNQWVDKLCSSGNSPWLHLYEEDTKELLEERFNLFAMICWNEEQAFVVPNFRVYGNTGVYAWDQIEDILFSLDHKGMVNSVEFNPQGIEIITTSADGTMRLWHKKTGKELLRVNYDKCRVTSASFNGVGTEIVVATDDGKIQIFAKYNTYTLQHIWLKKILFTWLQLQKPSKEIDLVKKLLDTVAQLLQIDCDELSNAWKSFPEHMQTAMWLSMHKKIQRYGK
jgi:hypothetical protein